MRGLHLEEGDAYMAKERAGGSDVLEPLQDRPGHWPSGLLTTMQGQECSAQ